MAGKDDDDKTKKAKGEGAGVGGIPLPGTLGIPSQAITQGMCEEAISQIRNVLLSEEPGFMTRLKEKLANLNDSALNTLSAMDVLGSPFVSNVPCGMGAFRGVDVTTGATTGGSLSTQLSSVIMSLPVPISLFNTLSMDAERVIPFLELSHKSPVTPRALRTLCSMAALSHAVGPGTISSMYALGYVMNLKNMQGLVVSSGGPGDTVVYLPPELCAENRKSLRTSLPSLCISQTQQVGTANVQMFCRVVALSVQGGSTPMSASGEAYLAYSEIIRQSGQSTLSKMKLFLLKLMVQCFHCIKLEHFGPLENVFSDTSRDPMSYQALESITSSTTQVVNVPTKVKRRRGATEARAKAAA